MAQTLACLVPVSSLIALLAIKMVDLLSVSQLRVGSLLMVVQLIALLVKLLARPAADQLITAKVA